MSAEINVDYNSAEWESNALFTTSHGWDAGNYGFDSSGEVHVL